MVPSGWIKALAATSSGNWIYHSVQGKKARPIVYSLGPPSAKATDPASKRKIPNISILLETGP